MTPRSRGMICPRFALTSALENRATVLEVDRRSAGLKAGAARPRLRRLTALTPPAHQSVGFACARSVPSAIRRAHSAQRVAAGIPFLPSCDQGVEDDDQLAHAGNERNLRLLSLGNQASIEGLQHRVVQRGCAETGHVDRIADPAAASLDVALAAPTAAIVVIRGGA